MNDTAPAAQYYTAKDVAQLLQVDEKSVYRWALQDETMPCVRLGGPKHGVVRFPRERLERWLANREQGRGRHTRGGVPPSHGRGAA